MRIPARPGAWRSACNGSEQPACTGMPRSHIAIVELILVATMVAAAFGVAIPAASQSGADRLPLTHDLFLGGYVYGRVFRYYSRSLANFATSTLEQKERDREMMISLSVTMERHIRALRCPQNVLQAVFDLESELSARGSPREFRLGELDRFPQCVDQYRPELHRYWWTGRSVGSIFFLFENLDHPQVELRPDSSDRVLLEELKYLQDSSRSLYGRSDMPPQAESALKSVENMRVASSQKGRLDSTTRARIRQYMDAITEPFLPR